MNALKILVVEDDELGRQLVRVVLTNAGHTVVEAASVDEARERLAEIDALDLALLDIQIPGGGGEAVLAAIRADDTLCEVPCLAVTAYAMAGDRERLLATGFDGYISKPIDARTFADDILEYVRDER